jgi:hypothetical protein
MKDTRKQREIIAVLLTAGIGAVIGELYVKPLLTRQLGVRK